MTRLVELQAAFHALATRAPSPPLAAEAFLVGSRELSAAERAGIYADMYGWRLADSLREDYPKLASLLGDARFLALAGAYARAHPPDRPDLGQHGRHLPRFLRRLPAPERADLGDLAALEWARAEVFFEAPATAAAHASLAALGPAAFPDTSIVLVPALRVLALDHDVAALWRRLEAGEAAGAAVAAPTAVVVWRAGLDVFHAVVELDEARALRLARAGRPVSAICAAFADREDPAAAAFAALASWLDEGWVAAFRLPAAPGERA
ncbi:putative DNA-binding domain-containing protein [Anaeromyxobacter sp. Red801]|uniref:HvfC/BufC family peptide modification chaperone n=1 Tax=Anaeromyxobacter sp. Red801 TaxID=3411632 RepID=UPI003BA0E98D